MKLSTTVALFVCGLFCQAQDDTSLKTYFVKSGGDNFANIEQAKRVDTVDSADYIRTVATTKNNESLYNLSSILKEGNLS